MLSHTAHTANETLDSERRELISYNVDGVIFSQEKGNSESSGEAPIPCEGKRFRHKGASFDRKAVKEIHASIKSEKLAL